MGSGGRGEEDALVDWTYSALVVLRIACLLGVIYGFVKQHCDPLFRIFALRSTFPSHWFIFIPVTLCLT